jgi:hypothetical protein
MQNIQEIQRVPGASRLIVVEDGSGREHAVMQYSRDKDALGVDPEEDDVPALLHTAQAWPDLLAGAAGRRVIGKSLASRWQAAGKPLASRWQAVSGSWR